MERREVKGSGETAGVSVHSRAVQGGEREDKPSPGQEHRGGSAKVFELVSSALCKQTRGTAQGRSRAGQRDGESPSRASPGAGAHGAEGPGDGPRHRVPGVWCGAGAVPDSVTAAVLQSQPMSPCPLGPRGQAGRGCAGTGGAGSRFTRSRRAGGG